MIVKEKQPSVWWAGAVVPVALAASVSIWAIQFPMTQWNFGGAMKWLSTSDALLCLPPWDALKCRDMLSFYGFDNMRLVTNKQLTVFAPLIVGAGVAGFGVWRRWFRQKERIIEHGPTVAGMEDLLNEAKLEGGQPGLELFHGWKLNQYREVTGQLLFGAPGSGKTNLLRYLFRSASARGDRIIAYAFKPDMYGLMPPCLPCERDATGEPILINPADERSWVWDIAKDVNGEASALTIAQRLVPGTHEYFTPAAQSIVAMMIVKLHRTKRHQWTWAELFDSVLASQEQLIADAETYFPSARAYIAVEQKIWDSNRATVQNSFNHLRLLALAWPTYDGRNTISVRQFMHGSTYPKTLVLGHSGDYPKLASSWISLFLSFVNSAVFSTDYKPSPVNRTWIVVDELARLQKVEGLDDIVTAGRERGVCAVLGVQDFHAIEDIYGPYAFKTWMSSIQTKFLCRIEKGETASWLMKILGTTRIKYLRNKAGTNLKEWETVETHALQDSEMSTHLGLVAKKKGTWVVVLGIGKDLYRVFVPLLPLERPREDFISATWVRNDKEGRVDHAHGHDMPVDPPAPPTSFFPTEAAE